MNETSRWLRLIAGVGTALVALLIGAALFGADGVVRHERLEEKLHQLNALNADLRDDNARLKRVASGLRHDSEYVEQVIRDELGWVRDDEMVFLFQ